MSTAEEGVPRAFVPSRDVAPGTLTIVRERSAGEVVGLAQLLREALPTAIDASEDGKGGTRSMLGRAVVLLLATCEEQRQSFDRSIAARQEVDRLQQSEIVELQARIAALEATSDRLRKRASDNIAAAGLFDLYSALEEDNYHSAATLVQSLANTVANVVEAMALPPVKINDGPFGAEIDGLNTITDLAMKSGLGEPREWLLKIVQVGMRALVGVSKGGA